MFTASESLHLRSRSLPREARRASEEARDDADNDEEEDGLSQFEVLQENIFPDEDDSSAHQRRADRQLGSLTFNQHPQSPEPGWMDRGRSHLPFKADEISSSSETFSSPMHSNTGGLACQMDHKDDHQSSSGNWSGSSSTCPSHTSETIPPPASPPLTGSSHCDSELYLNMALNATEDLPGSVSESYCTDRLHDLDGHQAADMLDDPDLSSASYHQNVSETSCQQNFSPEPSRKGTGVLDCPSFTSISTFDSLDKPPSDKADAMSHYSVDAEGYFTSMHFDCGLKGSKSFSYNYASVDQQTEDGGGLEAIRRHSLSLRKPKLKPSPPERSSSLKKIHQPKIPSEENLLMSSKDSISQLESSDPSDPAQGGQISKEIPDVALPRFTNDSIHSDSDDFWLLNDLKSADPFQSLSNTSTVSGTTVTECIKLQESLESQNSLPGLRASTPSVSSTETEIRPPSPEKLVNLASPSSGYSSQSETPTSSVPSAFFPNAKPSVKRKPKVPERKSSLTSLQRKASKKDLELPMIPPSHLDLSAIYSKRKPPAHNHVVHNSKRKVDKHTSGATLITPDVKAFKVTPVMLHTVQLCTVSKPEVDQDHPCTDTATRPKCFPALLFSKPHEPRIPPPNIPFSNEPPSQDNCESLFTPVKLSGPDFESPPNLSFSQNRYDSLAPVPLSIESTSQELSKQEFNNQDISQNAGSLKVLAEERTSTPDESVFQSIVMDEKDQDVRSEPAEDDTSESPPDERGSTQESLDLDRAPDSTGSSHESSRTKAVSDDNNQEEEESGASSRSTSQETVEDGSTGDTEYDFSTGQSYVKPKPLSHSL